MAIEPSPTVKAIGPKPVGEVLWLAVTVVEFAVIMGIVCWPLSAELLPRLATGAAAASRSVSAAPATRPSTDAAPSPTYSVNRLPLPDASLPGVDLAVAVEGFSGGASTTTLGAQAGSSGVQSVQSSPGDPGGPAPAARRPQQARSDPATRKKPASPSRPAPTLTPPTARDSGW